MRLTLFRIAVVCLLASSCRLWPDEDFPDAASPFVPPPKYRAWWELVESCSGKQAPFESIAWFKVPVGDLVVRGETAAGAWFVFGNRIAIVTTWADDGPVVRHEMLHAILGTGDHPERYFRGMCGDEVAYSHLYQPPAILDDAVPLSPYAFDADVVLFPSRPSLSVYNGRATIVLRVRNPTGRSVYLEPDWQDTHCAAGFMLTSVADPQRYEWECRWFETPDGRAYFRPGETRRMVFEVILAYRGHAFPAEPVTISAIIADNLRGTTAVTLLP